MRKDAVKERHARSFSGSYHEVPFILISGAMSNEDVRGSIWLGPGVTGSTTEEGRRKSDSVSASMGMLSAEEEVASQINGGIS